MATADFVTQLFQNMFGRTPSATELNQWVGRIDSGAESSSQVAVDLVSSPEALTQPRSNGFTRPRSAARPISPGSKCRSHPACPRTRWRTTSLVRRNSDGVVNPNGGAFDVTNFATKLYTNILGRAPDSGGFGSAGEFL